MSPQQAKSIGPTCRRQASKHGRAGSSLPNSSPRRARTVPSGAPLSSNSISISIHRAPKSHGPASPIRADRIPNRRR